MNEDWNKFANEMEKELESGLDFSDEGELGQAASKLLDYLDQFRVGPAALSLLTAFAFPKETREKIWQEVGKTVRENRRWPEGLPSEEA